MEIGPYLLIGYVLPGLGKIHLQVDSNFILPPRMPPDGRQYIFRYLTHLFKYTYVKIDAGKETYNGRKA